jgi:hypothetical protein
LVEGVRRLKIARPISRIGTFTPTEGVLLGGVVFVVVLVGFVAVGVRVEPAGAAAPVAGFTVFVVARFAAGLTRWIAATPGLVCVTVRGAVEVAACACAASGAQTMPSASAQKTGCPLPRIRFSTAPQPYRDGRFYESARRAAPQPETLRWAPGY